jgi:hypothetical protein
MPFLPNQVVRAGKAGMEILHHLTVVRRRLQFTRGILIEQTLEEVRMETYEI